MGELCKQPIASAGSVHWAKSTEPQAGIGHNWFVGRVVDRRLGVDKGASGCGLALPGA